MPKTIIITGASSGFGAMTARHLADAGHVVYASMRDVAGRNARAAADAEAYAGEHGVDLRVVEMDVSRQALRRRGDRGRSARARGARRRRPQRRPHGPRAAGGLHPGRAGGRLQHQRALDPAREPRGARAPARPARGPVVWVGSSSTRGGTPPYLGPYFAAKAAEDSVAVTYAAELARFGIETTIVVPGAFTTGTNHFANAGHPADTATAQAYEELYAGLTDEVARRLAAETPADADPEEVARTIARVVDLPHGQRPFRVHIDPMDDGATEVNAVGDAVRRRFYQRIGLEDLLEPAPARTPRSRR